MLFESRSFWHAKSLEFALEYEDAFEVGDNGVVAIADGVSSAIFSRAWARILTSAVVEQSPNLSDAEGFRNWLAQRRAEWLQSIDLTKLTWMQRQKLQQVRGAYSTLLWAEFFPWQEADSPPDSNGPLRFLLRSFAVGDCCLFHIRDGQLLRRFPLETVDEFAEDPITICSVNLNHDHLLEFHTLEDICLAGDMVFLTSDALAKWIYQELEADRPVAWDEFWNLTEDDWNQRVADLRDLPSDCRMRVDDTTLVMLRLGPAVTVQEPAAMAAAVPMAEPAGEEERLSAIETAISEMPLAGKEAMEARDASPPPVMETADEGEETSEAEVGTTELEVTDGDESRRADAAEEDADLAAEPAEPDRPGPAPDQ